MFQLVIFCYVCWYFHFLNINPSFNEAQSLNYFSLCTFKCFLFIFKIIKYLNHHVILFSRNFFPSSVSMRNDILLFSLWYRIFLFKYKRFYLWFLFFLSDEWYQFICLVFGYFPCEFWVPLSTKFLHMKKRISWYKMSFLFHKAKVSIFSALEYIKYSIYSVC